MMLTMVETLEAMSTFADLLGQAASAGAEVLENAEACRVEAVGVVERTLALVTPIMPLIDGFVKDGAYHPGGEWAHWEYSYLDQRGVVLCGEIEKERQEDRNRGTYEGHDLVLQRDGTLVHREFNGHWSSWQGEPDHWSTEITPVDAAKALEYFTLEAILGGVVETLRTAATASHKRKDVLARRLEHLLAAKNALAGLEG